MEALARRKEEAPDPELARQKLRLWIQMLKAVRHIENDLREGLRLNYATTLPRFDAMAMLDRAPEGLKLTQLSEQMMVSNGNVTGIINRLEEDGLVVRTGVEGDRRASVVRLTPEGKALMTEMAAEHLAWIDRLMAPLDEADVARGIAMMIELRRG